MARPDASVEVTLGGMVVNAHGGRAYDGEDNQIRLEYFIWATTQRMAAYPGSADDVPEGLTLARWSLDGRQEPGSGR